VKLTYPLLISILTVSSALPAATVTDLTFTLNGENTEYSVSDCDQFANGYLDIPSIYNSLPVTSIGDGAFFGCSRLIIITIPNSVTSVGDNAFVGCSRITSVTIPDSLTTTGYGMFRFCTSLTSITIPDSLTSIADRTFDGCTALTNITIPNSVTSIGQYAFQSCSSLNNIIIPDSVITIGASAFHDCSGLTSITIPDSVNSIALNAFADTGLSSLSFSNPLLEAAAAERDARPTQSAYDGIVNERDAVHAKFGSNLIAVDAGIANFSVEFVTSDDLSIWTTGGTASATVSIDGDAQFLRFSMTDDPDSLSDVYQLFHTQSWSQETGYKRVALIKYPNSDAQSHPVIVVLHGAGSNAYSMMSRYLDLDSYILVALQGYGDRWNIMTEPTKADDLDYVENIINQLKTYSDVDADNISLLGSSNGAAMVNRAMIELPAGTFKNAITLASQLSTDQYNNNTFWGDDNNDGVYNTSYTLSQDLRVLSLHGTGDDMIFYSGQPGITGRPFLEAGQSSLILARALGYSGDLASSTTPFYPNTNILKYEYLDGNAVHYKFIGGDHGFSGLSDVVLNIVDDFISGSI
jgi:poly(3-hydroxybutyrate) depolymerase